MPREPSVFTTAACLVSSSRRYASAACVRICSRDTNREETGGSSRSSVYRLDTNCAPAGTTANNRQEAATVTEDTLRDNDIILQTPFIPDGFRLNSAASHPNIRNTCRAKEYRSSHSQPLRLTSVGIVCQRTVTNLG